MRNSLLIILALWLVASCGGGIDADAPDGGGPGDAASAVDGGAPAPDAGSAADAGAGDAGPGDAGALADAGEDAGFLPDAGEEADGGSLPDAGEEADGGSLPDAGEEGDAGTGGGDAGQGEDPCAPNPCTEPPPAACLDDAVLLLYPAPGLCTVSEEAASCDYQQGAFDCHSAGQQCQDGACVSLAVEWCNLQWPHDLTAAAGEPTTWYGRVFVQGITDRSTATDPDPLVVAEFGMGPRESDPASAAGWSWSAAQPNPGWIGSGWPDENNDEYQAAVAAPAQGLYDVAFRFSADAGATWTFCDTGGSGPGDPYQAADAGRLTVP